jgi:hypothetical protein
MVCAIQRGCKGQQADLSGDEDEHECGAGKENCHEAVDNRKRAQQGFHRPILTQAERESGLCA